LTRAAIIARSERILAAVKAGEEFGAVAQRENVSRHAVYHLAERKGIYRGTRHTTNSYNSVPPNVVWMATAARDARERGLVRVAEMHEERLRALGTACLNL